MQKLFKLLLGVLALIGALYVIMLIYVTSKAEGTCTTNILQIAKSPDQNYLCTVKHEVCKFANKNSGTNQIHISLLDVKEDDRDIIFIADIDTKNSAFTNRLIGIFWKDKNNAKIIYHENIKPFLTRDSVFDIKFKFYLRKQTKNSYKGRNEALGAMPRTYESIISLGEDYKKVLDRVIAVYPGIFDDKKIIGPHEVTLDSDVEGFAYKGEKVWSVRITTKQNELHAVFFVNKRTYNLYEVEPPQ